MNYIIFDLEWNNVYDYRKKQGFNEIIEIGAVKLDDKLELSDTFNQLIKPSMGKKLGKRFTQLTGITKEEVLESGISFDDAFERFSDWCGDGDNILLSWSNSDLFTLVSNFKMFKGTAEISFMKKYADAQKFCTSFFDDLQSTSQIGLSVCAERLNINTDEIQFHRAVEDCYVAALCFRKLYDKNKFSKFISVCDDTYFDRLTFKKYFISKAVCDDFNINEVELDCPICSGSIKPIGDYVFSNNTFKGTGICTSCNKKFWTYIRAKKTYDDVIISKRVVKMSYKKARNIDC